VRLVQHPGADLPLLQGLAYRAAAKLLRRNEQDGDVAEAQAIEHVATLRH
jgi:hypothetical protein